MSYRDDLIGVLSKSENLGLALEIADHVPEVKARLLRRFWTELDQRLRTSLQAAQASGKFSGWRVDFKADRSIALQPTGWTEGTGRVSPMLEKAGDFLEVGIFHGGVQAAALGEVSAAHERLSAAIREKGYMSANLSWLGWKRVESRGLSTAAVLEEIAQGRRLALEYADTLWTLFESHADALDEVNRLASGPRPT